jgi:2-amino-4-hydroxy-6-hydroxymethyldihydropteridine diphosphokinase
LNLVPAYVALGSNLRDPAAQVKAGVEELAMLPDTRLVQVSSLYRTAPVGFLDQPDFVNAVALIETALTPRALLDALLAIERRYGRVRDFPNAPRTLDLDILLYGQQKISTESLTVPHPRLTERAFALIPLLQLDPFIAIPGKGPAHSFVPGVAGQAIKKV